MKTPFLIGKILLISLLISVVAQSADAQTLYYRTKGKKIGMVDAQGNVVIPIEYSAIEPWGKGLYRVQKGIKSGICNDRGQLVIPVDYTHLTKLNDKGRALIGKGGKRVQNSLGMWQHACRFGVLDEKARFIVPCEYKGIFEFVYDASQVAAYGDGTCLEKDESHSRLNEKYYRLAHFLEDTLTTDCRYLGISDGIYKTEKSGLLDVTSGKVLIPADQYDIILKPVSGMARYYATKHSNTTYGYVNIETGKSFEVGSVDKKMKDITYMTHSDFHGNVAAVNDGKVWRVINRSGETIRNNYNDIRFHLPVHMWIGRRGEGTLDVFDEDGRDKPGFQGYADIMFPDDMGDIKVFPLKDTENKWGLLNSDGTLVAPFDYQEVRLGCSNVVAVKKDGLWGFVNSQGKQLVECKYMDVEMPVEPDPAYVWYKEANGFWCQLNLTTGQESPMEYAYAEPFRDGLAWVRPKEMKLVGGVLDAALTTNSTDSVSSEKLGIIINEQGEVMFPEAVTSQLLPQIKILIAKKGGIALNRTEAHRFLLQQSAENRMYPMNTKINDNDWDY